MVAQTIESVPSPRGLRWSAVGLVLVGGTLPLLLYWLLLGQSWTITPQQALTLLREPPGTSAALIDVRSEDEFQAGHIDGAVSWPLDQIQEVSGPADVPTAWQGRSLLLVCNVGLTSNLAARHLTAQGVERVHSVRGGNQEWIRAVAEELGRMPTDPFGRPQWRVLSEVPRGELFQRWRTQDDGVVEFPHRLSPPLEQLTGVVAFFVIKPTYTLLSLLIVVLLWKSRTADLVALRWGQICFFVGENACAANYFIFKETSYLFEYLHSLGMLACFGFVAYAVLEGFDRRILQLSDPQHRCAALSLCGRCIKLAPVPCGLRRTFYLIIPALMLVALMLPTADWQDNSYNTLLFGQLYHYGHLRIYQLFENWYCAWAAILMLGASLGILAFAPGNSLPWAKVALSAGVGPLVFGLLRMVTAGAYDQNRVWYLFWEESTELLFIGGICGVLWIFRRGLGLQDGETADRRNPVS